MIIGRPAGERGKLAERLQQLGTWHVESMAAWSLEDLPTGPTCPDLVIIDQIAAPLIHGIHEHFPWCDAPLLLVVERDSADAERLIEVSGADEVLLYPTYDAELIQRIRSLLSVADTRRQLSSLSKSGEERYALLAVGSNDGLWDWNLTTGQVYYSPRWKSMLGHTDGEIGESIEEWLSRVLPEDLAWVDATLEEQIESPSPDFRIEYRMLDADGQIRWMLCRGCAVSAGGGGRAIRMAGSMTDITAHKQRENELRQSEERYALAAKASNDGLWDWDLATDTIFYAPRWKQMIGFEETEISASPNEWFDRVAEDDLIWLQAAIEGQVDRDEEPFQIEYRMRHADGSFRWMLCHGLAIRDLNGKTIRLVGSQSDISTRKSAEQRVLHDAFHDRLTGLPNRALFLDRLTQLVRRPAHEQPLCVVLLAEVNRFTHLADSLGPEPTDQLLMEIAARLSGCLDNGDTVARLDGAQFGFLFESGTCDDAMIEARALRIKDAMAQQFIIGDRSLYATVRLGATIAQGTDLRAEDLVRDAGRAMHRGAQEGRSSLAIFTAEEDDLPLDALQLEQALRVALEAGNQIELYYQPIIDLATRRLAGFESLMRWRHPELGMISPSRFIPLAEQSDLILVLGRFAMDRACRQLKSWQETFPAAANLFMNVNVSGTQLLDDNFLGDFQAILIDTGINPERIKLEITESVILGDADRAYARMQALKDMKLKLAIDDFGTGYSSLSYLHKFQFDAVKIDQSFVRAMQIREENTLIIRMISDLAQGMGCEVVAEGVETAIDADKLTKLGCTYGQGFHFGRPKDAAASLHYLTLELTPTGPLAVSAE